MTILSPVSPHISLSTSPIGEADFRNLQLDTKLKGRAWCSLRELRFIISHQSCKPWPLDYLDGLKHKRKNSNDSPLEIAKQHSLEKYQTTESHAKCEAHISNSLWKKAIKIHCVVNLLLCRSTCKCVWYSKPECTLPPLPGSKLQHRQHFILQFIGAH